MKPLSDERDPDAPRIVRACDNLRIHRPAAFVETFAPAEADAWSDASSGTTPRNTAVGSTSRRWSGACRPARAWAVASPITSP
ncbi:MAG: hypothetical protein AAGG38_15185 [Planctomycetota bacterium]